MKCTKCLKEMNDDASFCGYCGQVNNKDTYQVAIDNDSMGITEETSEDLETSIDVSKKDIVTSKQKKYIGFKILLFLSIIAMVAGATLGILTAKGIINFSNVITKEQFEWTDYSDGYVINSDSITNEEKLTDEKTSISEDGININ